MASGGGLAKQTVQMEGARPTEAVTSQKIWGAAGVTQGHWSTPNTKGDCRRAIIFTANSLFS